VEDKRQNFQDIELSVAMISILPILKENLSKKGYEVIEYMYNTYMETGYRPTQRTIARYFNCTQASVARYLKKARIILKDELGV
jgi:hypothetical protein